MMQHSQHERPHCCGTRRDVQEVYHVGLCRALHVPIDHPDHEDNDHSRGERKSVERTARTSIVVAGTIVVGTVGSAISDPQVATERAAKGGAFMMLVQSIGHGKATVSAFTGGWGFAHALGAVSTCG
jgi:hypothetical protein